MQLFFALLSLVAFASALQISSPSATEGWSTLGPNYVTWNRVSTDPLNFTIVLVNEVRPLLLTYPHCLPHLIHLPV